MSTLQDYDFFVPQNLIATRPLENRSCSKLLVALKNQTHHHNQFADIKNYLRNGDVLVVNDTKVIKARLTPYKATGGKTEVFLNKKLDEYSFSALVRNVSLKKLPATLWLDDKKSHHLEVIKPCPCDPEGVIVKSSLPLDDLMDIYGQVPIPPYMNREADEKDETSYQTMFAKNEGAIAAPTAGLHFDNHLLAELKTLGVSIAPITLHVGLGTFLPIKSATIDKHKMHSEDFVMNEKTALLLNKCKKEQRRIIAVGTTSLRVLEHLGQKNPHEFFPVKGNTDIFIKPGFSFTHANGLITNFHTPKSTLFLLICAIIGKERALKIYQEAVSKNYRFYSYGDACFFEISS